MNDTLLCPSCSEPLIVVMELREYEVDKYEPRIEQAGHERCDVAAIVRTVRRSLKRPRVKRGVMDSPLARRPMPLRNGARGKVAERAWAAYITKLYDAARASFSHVPEIDPPQVRGVLGGADMTWHAYACEVKSSHGGWPSKTIIRNAHAQAVKNAQGKTPVVIACKTTHNSREWRVFVDNVAMDAADWISLQLLVPEEA